MTKWQSEAEMNAELRRIANEMRQVKEEFRSYISGESEFRRGPTLPTEDERKLRRIDQDRKKEPRK
jgi:hypothetical protein